ncbi:mercury(II) reductase [Geomonas sp. RF6]|uniref:mercury(II) reductase n=1 Tax=Geomonas sp. RF6 TaxID=2897342 RepID=UPI001E493A3D|nr:mercury(II) reductase [Geomonas sp. RF6]UFS71549.1 mercury(II) reductase [Geomonas sp. RF6]
MDKGKEIIIVGSGSTAFAAALRAQAKGAQPIMIEKSMLGGTCINWGCIPSKTLIHAALLRHEAKKGGGIGVGTGTGDVDFTRVNAHKAAVVKHLRKTRYLDVLEKVPDLKLIKGSARFLSNDTLQVGSTLLKGDSFIVAVGGAPRVPAIPGLETVPYLTSRTALLLKKLPSSLTVIGGGVIALELGQMFSRLGVPTTILEHGARLLPGVEEEVVLALYHSLAQEGLKIVVRAGVVNVEQRGGVCIVQAEVDGTEKEFLSDTILVATGTAPATAGIGLEAAGVELNGRGYIKVDPQMRTTAPGIWAAGDVTGGMQLATVGAREGIAAVDNILTPECRCTVDYRSIPMAIFTDPEVGMVGYGEGSAKEAGFDVITHTISASAIPKAHVTSETRGAIKIIADKVSGRILGVHLCCHRGADIINEAALAVRFRLTVSDLADTLHVYPSMGEGLRLCAQGFRRDLDRLSCCAE